MILYFSGTGNSKFVAERIQKVTGDELVSINGILRGERSKELNSKEDYVFVLPVYVGRIPRVVEECIKELKLGKNSNAYFILTCYTSPYSSEKYLRKLCKKKKINIIGFDYVIMPQSYIVLFKTPSHKKAVEIYKDALPKIDSIANAIKEHQTFENEVTGVLMSDISNPFFYPLMITAKGFRTNKKCTGCGNCVKNCPLNNIALNQGKPEWGSECTHCMACIDGCPNKAVNFSILTLGKTRNFNIAKDL